MARMWQCGMRRAFIRSAPSRISLPLHPGCQLFRRSLPNADKGRQTGDNADNLPPNTGHSNGVVLDMIAAEMKNQLRSVASGAQQRALKRGIPAEVNLSRRVMKLFELQNGRCALTGIAFDLREVGQGRARHPFAASLDRVDSSGGYTRDNIRLVCQVVNFALNAYGEDVFYEMARAAVAHSGDIPPAIEARDTHIERQRKRRYIDHVVKEAPRILASHGGCMKKQSLRHQLRDAYQSVLPEDEANAYGWAFRRLTEQGDLEPSSHSTVYRLRAPR